MDHVGDGLSPVLVTGASGFLGRRVLSRLQDDGVRAVGTDRGGGEFLQCDLTDRGAVTDLVRRMRPATVVHCAAQVPRNTEEYADAAAAQASLRMVENIVSAAPCRMVFSSSMTVYPDAIELAREDDAAPQGEGYAACKLQAERVLMAAPNVVATILRLPGLFGRPRQSGVLFNAALAFATGTRPSLAKDLPRWSSVHVDDAADVVLRAVHARAGRSRVMNVGYPGAMAIGDAVRRLAAQFDVVFNPGECRWFTLDLTVLARELGLPSSSFNQRLQQLAEWARALARSRFVG